MLAQLRCDRKTYLSITLHWTACHRRNHDDESVAKVTLQISLQVLTVDFKVMMKEIHTLLCVCMALEAYHF